MDLNEKYEDIVDLIIASVADYVELFHSREDIMQAVKGDMEVMDIPYEATWERTIDPSDEKDCVWRLNLKVTLSTEYTAVLFFYYWD